MIGQPIFKVSSGVLRAGIVDASFVSGEHGSEVQRKDRAGRTYGNTGHNDTKQVDRVHGQPSVVDERRREGVQKHDDDVESPEPNMSPLDFWDQPANHCSNPRQENAPAEEHVDKVHRFEA